MFLTKLFNDGLSYSSINSARSALSALIDFDKRKSIGTHPLISRFLKGVYEPRTPKPRYQHIWDISPVLDYLRGLPSFSDISLKQLTFKLLMLIALTSAQRLQTLQMMDIKNLIVRDTEAIFVSPKTLKQSKPGSKELQVVCTSYSNDERLDVLRLLNLYLKRTSTLRGKETMLFISYVPPHKAVSRDTLSRWLKEVLKASGIDLRVYSAHSTRAAATSAACNWDIPLEEILKTAGWSSEKTFAKFYKRQIDFEGKFAMSILKQGVSDC